MRTSRFSLPAIARRELLRRANPFSSPSGDPRELEDGGATAVAAACKSLLSRSPSLRQIHHPEDSLADLARRGISLSPETIRRLWRLQILDPADVNRVFEGFGSEVRSAEVDFLLELFLFARRKGLGFTNLPEASATVISMLVQHRSPVEAESLLYELRSSGFHSPAVNDLFSEIIEKFAEVWRWKRAISAYDSARCDPRIVLRGSCYRSLVDRLVRLRQSKIAARIYVDMVDAGLANGSENRGLELAVRSLCEEEKVLESVKLVKKLRNLGIRGSRRSLDCIAEAYRKKRDFEDLRRFLQEWNHVPESRLCNRIISSISRVSGTSEASSFVRSLENLGYVADEQSLGILVRGSCREGNLKNALIYFSEIYSRRLEPDLQTYNSFLGALSKDGMWECAIQILAEVREKGIKIEISTFRVVLAGLCMKRRFSEIEIVLGQMEDLGFLDSKEEGVSRAFSLLGLDDLGVKIKRDNGLHSSDVEFFDSLGNGLFLCADLKLLQMRLNRIMDDSMDPNFDLMIEEDCRRSRVEASLKMVEQAALIGETLSLSTFSTLFQALVRSKPSKIEEAFHLLKEIPDLLKSLDHEALNLSLVSLYKKGFSCKMRTVMEVMIQRRSPIKKRSFMAVASTCHKENDLDTFDELWDSIKGSDSWLPELRNAGFIFRFLIEKDMLERGFDLFAIMSMNDPKLIPSLSSIFIKELCESGSVGVGLALFEEIANRVPHVLEYPCYEHLMEGFSRGKKFAEAFLVMDLLRENVLLGVSLSSGMWETIACVLLGFSRKGKKICSFNGESEVSFSLSRVLLDELGEIGRYDLQKLRTGNLSFFPFESISNMMVSHYSRTKNSRRAYEFLSLMIKMDVRLELSTYCNLLSLTCSIGRVLVGLNLKEQMLKQQETPQTIYNILMFYLSKNGNISTMDSVLDEMRERLYVLDQVSYNLLVYGYHRCGESGKSVETLNIMISKGMEPTNRSLRIAMDYLCRQKRVNKALELFQKVETKAWKHGSAIQSMLIKRLVQSSRVDEAESLLRRLQEEDRIPKKANYDSLIECFCKIGRVKTGIVLLNLMLKKGDVLPSERSYDLVLKGLLSIDALEEALDIHGEILGLEMQPSKESNEMLIRGLCCKGRTIDAEKILDVMIGLGQIPSRDVFQCVLARYRRERNLHKAPEFLKKMQRFGVLPEFEAHWSLISSLSSSSGRIKEQKNDEGKGFLSRLLFQTGFDQRESK